MPVDPDQDDRIDIDLSDVDLTDELPVLIEAAVFESDKRSIAVPDDADSERTAQVLALAAEEAESLEGLKRDLEQRAAKIEALESDIARLSNRWLDIERRSNEKDSAIASLTVALDAARSALEERRDVEDKLAAEIADRDNRIARLLDKADLLQKQTAEARVELDQLREQREVERREAEALRADLERRAPADRGQVELGPLVDQLEAQAKSSTAELEAARKEIADIRSRLESTRADAAKMEHSLRDKDHELAQRDERIRALQLDLQQRAGALDQPLPADAPRETHGAKTLQQADAAAESASTPALICLTSDGPRRFALAKATVTIGRSSGCDIQILTHFVSREHARLTVSPRGGVLIEDLGSTNGVFVNAIRVDRQELHHGDVVTVGESQFRFLETMAH